jgi:hypothetical protein
MPESLGELPADLPLPPRFALDEARQASVIGPSPRNLTLYLMGPLSAEEVRHFFLDHLRLARWKPVESEGNGKGTLRFRKGKEEVEVTIASTGKRTCRVHIVLNAGGEGGERP